MALPAGGKVPWPPKEWRSVYNMYAEHDAWYSGDTERLASIYGGGQGMSERRPWWRFWGRNKNESPTLQFRSQLHIPIAGDVASASASLVFGEAPGFRIPEAHGDEATDDAIRAQERLDEIVQRGGVVNRLLEAAETCAAMGGVFLKPTWDTDVAPFPLLEVIQTDAAVPTMRFGRLVAVTLWRTLEVNNRKVWRHLERHETTADGKGYIFNGLYEGTMEELGQERELTAQPDTAKLQPTIDLPFPGLGVRYVPNVKPNRRFRIGLASALGQSDFAGSEGLMDALDEVYTSWMRDIRLAKARIMVPEEYLKPRTDPVTGKTGFTFDLDQEVFVPLDAPPTDTSEKSITLSQFAIRAEEHHATALDLIRQIVNSAGYNAQTFGLDIAGRAESGTALRIRERKSFSTQQKKQAYWRPEVEDVLYQMMVIDKSVEGLGGFGQTLPMQPRLEMADSIQPDPMEVANSIEVLNRAQAVSIETKVRMAHTDWGADEVAAEVERLKAELGMSVPDPTQVGAGA